MTVVPQLERELVEAARRAGNAQSARGVAHRLSQRVRVRQPVLAMVSATLILATTALVATGALSGRAMVSSPAFAPAHASGAGGPIDSTPASLTVAGLVPSCVGRTQPLMSLVTLEPAVVACPAS